MQKERFHYCLPMETMGWEFKGLKKCSSGMASAFSNPTYLKKECRAFLKKIRKRIDDIITNDETLRLLLINDIKRLDKEFGRISHKNNNDIEIFAYFFKFIAHLLGWAHFDGNFYRTPIYHQTEKQREKDLSKLNKEEHLNKSAQPNFRYGLYEFYKKRQIIKQLRSEDNSYTAIAIIMNLTVSNVKALENAQHLDEKYQKSLSQGESN